MSEAMRALYEIGELRKECEDRDRKIRELRQDLEAVHERLADVERNQEAGLMGPPA